MPELILSCSCCSNWDMFDNAAVDGRSGERCCRVTVCSVSTAREWKEGRGGSGTDIRIRKKRKTEGEWGIMMSIYTACRVEKKLGQKEKGKRRWSFQGEGKRGGSVFILAQVSLFFKVIILWRCKSFLQIRQDRASG